MTFELLAAAGEAAPQNSFGFMEAMEQGGIIAWSILAVLVIMSVGSFYILFTKLLEQRKVMSQYKAVRTNFWKANSLRDGATKLDKNSAWRQLVDDAILAEDQHAKMTDKLEAHDWMHGSLARSEDTINSKLAGGLPFLATVGATAPFVGLLGTVIGIYRALINIGIAGSASIDKVAGPVGEALIMTAIGLLVAVPAVFAYNWLQGRNKRIAEMLGAFTTDLLAYINSNGTVKPAAMTATSTQQAAKAARTAPAGATTTTTTTVKK
ncbi:MotA/TolQ/ExbB proton channel family protein [Qipengyuania citrea]|jgi:biopolymer transport protein ExbB|uniref:Biopolymer transport protein ExbB n=2 Tax=Qipengyuania TaxID=1855416 RepID=A0ABY4U512_9SPHN|nr:MULTISPECIES: MotA/TolQ/ExbB proton channel family protein [Qipengyuania]MAB46208.1 flagellar motor protein MotA [Sphingomonadaceae bacterium]MCH2497880.1 MotA/TolQ/ExbB proton channel family protein [Erythrobacter sp.]MEC7951800.1 MotA/TolQ/ExbB proton channel family protein [Pseudomonadota bacterium]QPL40308.1 MotA/TolQ/ExbB proton channel family protein [Erythrobacter sp. A30-3]MAQ65253.1 flagellar motor protein MotA [Sphingomonadaceae bacterium]|tara:strand:- start:1152 stop:1949 length:798 start_codon:yes stop_codon:yes gene_type:complete